MDISLLVCIDTWSWYW